MASRQSPITLKELLKKSADQLSTDEKDALLALALGKNKEYIYKNPGKKLNRSNVRTFYKLLNKRLAGWSLAYLQGHKEFYGLKFLVSKHTLIPRPESELIVEEALKFITRLDSQRRTDARREKDHRVIDIGTGSGCLILSLAKNFAEADYLATDISNKALLIAKTNARKLKLKNKVKFIKSDLLNKIPPTKFDIVMANLPYLKPMELKEPSIKKEPTLALLSGPDGLEHYRKLLSQLPKYLNQKYLILLEINPEQTEAIKKAVEKSLPKNKIKFLKDLAGNVRVAKINH